MQNKKICKHSARCGLIMCCGFKPTIPCLDVIVEFGRTQFAPTEKCAGFPTKPSPSGEGLYFYNM